MKEQETCLKLAARMVTKTGMCYKIKLSRSILRSILMIDLSWLYKMYSSRKSADIKLATGRTSLVQ